MARKIVMFLTLFLLALTSGAAFVIWLDFNPSGLSPTFYAEKWQHAIRVFMIPLNTVAILSVLFTMGRLSSSGVIVPVFISCLVQASA